MDYSKSGFVYVLQMEGHPYYKIGRTVDLKRRFNQISPQMPGRLTVVLAHRVIDAWRVESELHRDFAELRLNGEWFNLNQDCLNEIKHGLLLHQATALYRRLAQTITNEWQEVYSSGVRFPRALYLASRRVVRRHGQYGRIFYGRRGTFMPEDADVLGAEFIG